MRIAPLSFLVLATAWIVLLVTAPSMALGVPASALSYGLGSVVCHQRPERSFHLAAAQLPVCARCFGLYAGAAVGALAALKACATLTTPRTSVAARTVRSPSGLRMDNHSTPRLILLAAAAPTVVTWGCEMLGLWAPGNMTRFAAALPLGAAVAVTVNYIGCARPLPIRPRPPRTAI